MDNSNEGKSIQKPELWIPSWEGSVEGWTKNFVHKNIWRVIPEHEFEDLCQDGYIYFLSCKNRYPTIVDPAHFMRIYQRSFINHFHDLSNARTKEYRNRPKIKRGKEPIDLDKRGKLSKELSEVELNLLLEKAPEQVRTFWSTFKQLPQAALSFWFDFETGTRETNEQRLLRLFGNRENVIQTLMWLTSVGLFYDPDFDYIIDV